MQARKKIRHTVLFDTSHIHESFSRKRYVDGLKIAEIANFHIVLVEQLKEIFAIRFVRKILIEAKAQINVIHFS